MRIYLYIFKPLKKTVNRSSRFIFYFFRLFTHLRKPAGDGRSPQKLSV
ncbi:hypothetical protein CKO_01726 [Citrobacter koseri ATCC BAA-895]|uniref:Uncharacterized protein n=1 Tax=Citrobacter koseri (strain ATCC BAA-895 / CDC 4225-83 / SGSC4696) TaxID=290338 RepID=A8AH92_CITK8|nr:hypothetical protein CKO_01726 [Citrobacter koseri ATCC BAA-895]